MATMPPIENVAKVELDFTWNGEHVMNVFHVATGGQLVAPDLPAIGLVFKDWWLSDYQGLVSGDAMLNFIRLTDLTSISSPQITYSDGLPDAGGGAGDSCSNNVSAIVIWDTNLRSRGAKGRTFTVGLPEGFTNGQTLETTYVNAAQTIFTNLMGDLFAMTPDSYFLGLVSYYSNKVLRETPEFHPFYSVSVPSQLGGIRTRLAGRRRRKRAA